MIPSDRDNGHLPRGSTPPGAEPILTVDSVGKSFRGRGVLTAASLRARPGEITAVLGRNGSGKTTLLRIACGRLTPDHGWVRLAETTERRPRHHRLARAGLFYLPDRDVFCRSLSMGGQLDSISRRFPVPVDRASSPGKPAPGAGDDRVLDAASSLGVQEHLDANPRSLSTGERKRAELALALLRRPRCLLADEPFRGVTPRSVPLVVRALTSLAGEGCAVVATGHEVRELLDVAHRVVWVTAGTTYDLGPPAEAQANHHFRRGYLGPGWESGR